MILALVVGLCWQAVPLQAVPLQAAPLRAASLRATPLTVAAASSLQLALRDFAEIFRAHSGVRPLLVFGSSGNLARQMEYGAPYDLFLSADEGWVAYLVEKGVLAPRSVTVYAQGRLALVLHPPLAFAPEWASADTRALALLRGKAVRHISLASPAHAPYGIAARQALTRAGMWAGLRGKLVYGENVRQALTFVETGNAEAGFTAEAIARGTRLQWLPVDGTLYSPIRQALGLRRDTPMREAAQQFVALLLAARGRALLARYGLALGASTTEGKSR
ncbi:MAG: molybdate ABC transporter substrate-binding protein [SAR324 cluster bacterium]|nr:molybdate ABC transporter substrate-binding protein [SAR324 cluster bacterium]